MDPSVIQCNKNRLIKAIPVVNRYLDKFHSINTRWAGAITAGMIETGCMPVKASRLFTPLIQDMDATKNKYSEIQEQLVNAILFEMAKKVVIEITDTAKFAINILKRNLFERTADVGYLATDAEIVKLLKLARDKENTNHITEQSEAVRRRLSDYQYEYTVYNEIVILDRHGRVQANLDEANKIRRSVDPLLARTLAINLHGGNGDNYLETYRETDLLPGHGKALVYSQKIEDPETNEPLGTLCLCFDFQDEMDRIFKALNRGNSQIVVAILNAGGNVMCTNNPHALPSNGKVNVNLNADFTFLTFNKRTYLASMVATDGYQGFQGLTWYALAMIDIEAAFETQRHDHRRGNTLTQQLNNYSGELSGIKQSSEELLDDMKLDSINGRVKATKFRAKAFVEVLQYVKGIGEEIDSLFSDAIFNLQETVVSSLFNDVRFRAFQGNNIADRNLYERANDVCWWALTPMFRKLLAKHQSQPLSNDEQRALTDNLQYINDLYTPYLRLVLADHTGVVVAVSNPPEDTEEHVLDEGLPTGQTFVGTKLEPGLVRRAMRLTSSRDYCVSDFLPTPLYGGRPTYVYTTAVRSPENDQCAVGVIQIVFDAEPQFQAMLTDVLPKNEKKQSRSGCFAVFADRRKQIISSTTADYPVGSQLPLEDALFRYKNGERESAVVELGGRNYAVGIQVSDGYREYKRGDGYVNDVICMIFAAI